MLTAGRRPLRGRISATGEYFFLNSSTLCRLNGCCSVKASGKYMRNNTRTTIYFAPEIFKALRMKAAATHRSVSEMVNEAVKDVLAEDAADLDAFALLQDDEETSFDSFVCGLRRRGKL
jgi:hypothetical protein